MLNVLCAVPVLERVRPAHFGEQVSASARGHHANRLPAARWWYQERGSLLAGKELRQIALILAIHRIAIGNGETVFSMYSAASSVLQFVGVQVRASQFGMSP